MIHYYLTFDVGIKNLAYCLVKYDTSKLTDDKIINGIEIIDWDILNVAHKPLYCKQIKNKRAICNCISKTYSLKIGATDHSDIDNLVGYCKTHTKKIIETNKLIIKSKKKNSNIDVTGLTTTKLYKISSNPVYKDNFNIQMERLLKALDIFYYEKIVKIYDTINCYDEVITNRECIIKNLHIYIENQPVFKNPVMKTISIGIFTYFIIKKINFPNIINSINFISASDKTKTTFIDSMTKLIDVNSKIDQFKKYDKRKEFTIEITDQIVPILPKTVLNSVAISKYILHKKKDDLADTLVYVIYLILNNK
jgi:hypothetical protein